DLDLFFAGAVIVGLLSNIGGPARQAMVADLLPAQQRAQGFGILRVTMNLSVTIGPAIGGFLASKSYLWLFISDAVASLTVAVILLAILPETRPRWPGSKQKESVALSFAGYGQALRDNFFMIFLAASTLMSIVYVQMNSTLAVYLRDIHSVDERGFGLLMTLNALIVVVFQFPITRKIVSYPPLAIMAAGSTLYAIGFAMYGWVSDYVNFQFAMVVITIGEMLVAPVSQALVAQLAPDHMRGRYMAVYGYSWTVSFAFGPLLAGLIMDNHNPIWVWYLAGIVGLGATAIFILLHRQVQKRDKTSAPTPSDDASSMT
ncbi:unnamed protein product, partial [marine sediment metagenome]